MESHLMRSMSVKLATSPATFPATRTVFSQNHIEGQLDNEDHETQTHSPQNLDLQGQIPGQMTGNWKSATKYCLILKNFGTKM